MKTNLLSTIFLLILTNYVMSQEKQESYTSKKWGFTISYSLEKTRTGIGFEDDTTFNYYISQYYRGQYHIIDILVTKYSDTVGLTNTYDSIITELEKSKLSDGFSLIDSLSSNVKSGHYSGVQKAFYNEFAGLDNDYYFARLFKTDRYIYSLTLIAPNLKRFNESMKILESFTILTPENSSGTTKRKRIRPR